MAFSFVIPNLLFHALYLAAATKSNIFGGSIFISPMVACLFSAYSLSMISLFGFSLNVNTFCFAASNSSSMLMLILLKTIFILVDQLLCYGLTRGFWIKSFLFSVAF